ncbi:SufS family cysteine desulfurase [Candidatus Palauibacter sp.]|uniref:SufS family cysteine desulfurase n=1 Tax=Candidatus Palauibacter sp. TaxID=3101350 RepID=UPI003B017AEA
MTDTNHPAGVLAPDGPPPVPEGASQADGGRAEADPGTAAWDVAAIRVQFPILSREVHGRPLVYLDSAASSQQPLRVLRRVARYEREQHANVHRGVHQLSTEATEAYEDARLAVATHAGAADPAEIVFTRGTTEAVNLVASSWGGAFIGADDDIVLTKMEHHSNLVPWQLLAARTGCRLHFVDVTADGTLDLDDLDRLLERRPRLVAFTHVSNSLGTINPVREIVSRAHAAGALALVDGAQAAPHLLTDVARLGCDFYAFSGHKMCGPTGVGALWARRELLEAMPPYQGGGEMISEVKLEGSSWAKVPHKFEAGTPNISGVVGFGEAARFLASLGREAIASHEGALTRYALERLGAIEGLRLFGPMRERTSVFSFTYGDVHPHDLSTILDQRGIAIRAGHHCNQPLMDHYDISGTARASLYVYSTAEEIDALCDGLAMAAEVFRGIS